MRKIELTLLAIAVMMIMGCGRNDMSAQLEHIDALLTDEKVDSAGILLDEISISNLLTAKDSAFYYLLQTEIQYRKWIPVQSDSAINYSVSYYQGNSDKEKLARTYYYKSVAILENKDFTKAVHMVKQAEELADKTDNLLLQHKIYETLSHYNSSAYEYELALHYAKKAYQIAKELDDKNREAIALIYMASNYSRFNKKDSLAICIQECLPLLDYITDKDKAYLYTRMGELYADSEPEMAKKYLLKAEAIRPQLWTYVALSNIFLKENDIEEAQMVWKKAQQMAGSLTAMIKVLSAMRQQNIEQKDYLQANALADSIIEQKELFYNQREQAKIAEIQAKYDKEAAERDIKEQVMGWGLVLLVIVLILITWLGNKSLKGMKAKKELAETKVQLEAYTRKAEELEKSDKTNTKEIGELHKKINELHHRHAGILAKGKELFDAIEAGGTTVRWGKDDFINYLEYYKLKDLPFVNEMETNYNRLSPKYIFFAVLEHEEHDEEDIQHIMGISENTLRSTRSRINSKKLNT